MKGMGDRADQEDGDENNFVEENCDVHLLCHFTHMRLEKIKLSDTKLDSDEETKRVK